jgi:hypothetical protein
MSLDECELDFPDIFVAVGDPDFIGREEIDGEWRRIASKLRKRDREDDKYLRTLVRAY